VLSTEGEDNGEWIIVDCGAAVAHIMQPAIREYYHLEEIWGGKSVRMKVGEVNTKLVKASEPEPAPKEAPARKAAAQPVAKAPARKAAAESARRASQSTRQGAAKTPVKKAANKTAAYKRVAAKAPARKATTAHAPSQEGCAAPRPQGPAPRLKR
jgi:ribosome-associated protein